MRTHARTHTHTLAYMCLCIRAHTHTGTVYTSPHYDYCLTRVRGARARPTNRRVLDGDVGRERHRHVDAGNAISLELHDGQGLLGGHRRGRGGAGHGAVHIGAHGDQEVAQEHEEQVVESAGGRRG